MPRAVRSIESCSVSRLTQLEGRIKYYVSWILWVLLVGFWSFLDPAWHFYDLFMIFEPSFLNLFEPVWTLLNHLLKHFESFWTHLNQFEPFRTLLNNCEPLWTYWNPVELSWTPLNHFNPCLNPFEPCWTLLDPFPWNQHSKHYVTNQYNSYNFLLNESLWTLLTPHFEHVWTIVNPLTQPRNSKGIKRHIPLQHAPSHA